MICARNFLIQLSPLRSWYTIILQKICENHENNMLIVKGVKYEYVREHNESYLNGLYFMKKIDDNPCLRIIDISSVGNEHYLSMELNLQMI